MGYRGEDAPRRDEERGRTSPWQGDGYPGGQPEYGPYDAYDQGYDTGNGGYQGQDAGNDWYGGQAAAAPGAGFADTGTYTLGGQTADEYGTGPRPSPRNPVRGYPPASAPGRAAPGPMGSGPMVTPHTGQQERYDGYDDRGYDYDEPAALNAAPVPDRRDGYDGYPPGAKTRSTGRPTLGPSGGKRSLLLTAVAVACVVIISAAVYVFLSKPESAAENSDTAGPLPTSGTAPSAQACVKQFGMYCHIELNTYDPAPLTVSELFPPAFVNETDKNSFSLVSTKLDKTCSNAVIGADLITALKSGKCTQIVRASYVSTANKIMGTIGVVNLISTNEAHYAGKVVGVNDFIAPLAAAKGVAQKLGQGTGVVEAEFKGHYLILTWSEFTNGTTPSSKAQDSQLEKFSADLIAGTANISLSQRMVTGAPASPGAAP